MVNNLTRDAENALLDQINGVATYAPTLPLKLALMTQNGTDTSHGVEVDGGGYSRQTIVFAAAQNGTTSNTNAPLFDNLPDLLGGQVVAYAIYDSAPEPRRLWFGPATNPRTVYAGDAYLVAAGALTLALT